MVGRFLGFRVLLHLLSQACIKDSDSKGSQESGKFIAKREARSFGHSFLAQTSLLAAISDWSHLHNGVSLKGERTVSAHNFKIFKTLPARNRRKINPWSD